jgi:hypothetical protein
MKHRVNVIVHIDQDNMEETIIITSNNRIFRRYPGGVRPSLPYQGIARRALNSPITYDTDIDVSAIIK